MEYSDPAVASGDAGTSTDSATFDLRNGVLQSDKSVYIIGSDMILTLIEPDLDLDGGKAETYDLDLIEWDSDAPAITMGDRGGAAFDPEPSGLRETGNNTGIFQVVVEIPKALAGRTVERGEEIVLEYTDWGPSGADHVGDEDEDVNLTIFTSNFGATIELDRKVYTWTGKIYITIAAPDHNLDPLLVDEIGDTDVDPIRISTRSAGIDNYRLVETGNDTGIFSGEVVLTGFSHDADGDGSLDVVGTPASGGGPTDGRLPTSDDDRITVSFEFSEDATVVATAYVRWHVAEVRWLEAIYPAPGTGTVRIADPDMSLDPESADSFGVGVHSDSDPGGINLTVTETGEATGVFEGTVYFAADGDSSGHRLRVAEGDLVTANYTDGTLPDPYSTRDDVAITDTAIIGADGAAGTTDTATGGGAATTDTAIIGADGAAITSSRGIDVTVYESAGLSLGYRAQNVPEPPPALHVYEARNASAPIWSWNASNATSAGFQTATAGLPDGLMDYDDLRISIYVEPFVPSPEFSIMLDDVVITGVRNGNPLIGAPDDATLEAESPAGAPAARLAAPRHDPPGLAVAHEPQGPFPLGTTEVTWTATDAATNMSDSSTQLVTVRDTTPPAVTRGADYAVRAPGDAVVLSANDYCPAAAEDAASDAILLRTAGGPAPDAAELSTAAGFFTFPVGETTTVTWIATDLSGNTGTARQDVTVTSSDTAATQVHATQSSSALPAAPDPLRARVTYLWAEPGAQAPGSEVSVRIAFSRPVALTAAYAGEEPGSHGPSLAMAGGGKAEYESGNGTSILTFSYVVPPGGAPDYAGASALGGPCTIRDAALNTGANMTLPDPGRPGIPLEVPPRVVRVFSDAAAGVYGAGSTIPVRVEFSGDVEVEGSALPPEPPQVVPPVPPAPPKCGSGTVERDGSCVVLAAGPAVERVTDDPVPEPPVEPEPPSASPLLMMETGPRGASAAYAGGSGTRMLTFHYTVRAGDVSPDLDYTGTGALELSGGTIKALGRGDDADLALPEPAAEPGLREGPGEIVVGTKPHVKVGVFVRYMDDCRYWHGFYNACSPAGAGVFEPGSGRPSASAARLGALAFNSLSAERGYPFFIDVSGHWITEEAGAAGPAGARAAEEALRHAHQNGGPLLYVGPASDRALHGMEEYAAEHGITMVSHSSAARSLAKDDGIYRLDPGTGHMARALAHMLIKGGFDAVVPVVQNDLYGTGAGADPFSYGLLGSLRYDLEPAGVRVERAAEFDDERAAAEIVRPLEAAVAAAGGAGAGRNVAVLYVGSDAALVRLAGGVGAGSPVVERSKWFAAGGAGAGAGTGVAGSPLIASDPAAVRFARWTELAAVQPAVERSGMTDHIDLATGSAAPTPAYAAYEAARILGRALVLAGGDPASVGPRVREAAELDGGPLGRTSLDAAGDLRLPVTYDAWSVSPLLSPDWRQVPGGQVSGNLTERAAPPGWQKAGGAPLRGMDTCGIILERSAFDIPGVAPGRISGPARQVVANAGTAEMPAVSITASDWRLHRGGGAEVTLPYSLTEMSVGGARPGAAFVPMAPDSAIPAGTPAGGSVAVDFRVNLSGVTKLKADSMTQTVTYGPEC